MCSENFGLGAGGFYYERKPYYSDEATTHKPTVQNAKNMCKYIIHTRMYMYMYMYTYLMHTYQLIHYLSTDPTNDGIAHNYLRGVKQPSGREAGCMVYLFVYYNTACMKRPPVKSFRVSVRHDYLWAGNLPLSYKTPNWTKRATTGATQTCKETYEHCAAIERVGAYKQRLN